MSTVLVTGGNGFLGRHLIRVLLQEDPNVRVRSFSRSGFPTGDGGPVESVQGDIANADDVDAAMEGVDEVYHLAGVVERSPVNPWNAYRTHVQGTRNVCEAMRKYGPRRCVVTSSSGTIAVSREPVVHTEASGYKPVSYTHLTLPTKRIV